MEDDLFEDVEISLCEDGAVCVDAGGESILDLAALGLCVVNGEISISNDNLPEEYRKEMFDALVRFGAACYLALGNEAAKKLENVPGTEYYDETTD